MMETLAGQSPESRRTNRKKEDMRSQSVAAALSASALAFLCPTASASSVPEPADCHGSRADFNLAGAARRLADALLDRLTIPLGLAEPGVPGPIGAATRPAGSGRV